MLAVLFPHMYEDLEYVLPLDDVAMEDSRTAVASRVPQQVNAQAGPSRVPY